MKRKIMLKMLLVAIVICFSCLLSCFVPTVNSGKICYSASIGVVGGFSDVVEDLKKDETFNIENYAVNENDNSLQVITIAESNEKELFVYVYQPSGEYKNLVATSMFLSTASRGLEYRNYTLTQLNSRGVFYKYRVNNFVVSNDSERHYEITSIYRKFDETIDEKLNNDNTISEIEYKVAKHWFFRTTTNGTEISCQDIETITITSKYVGFARYGDLSGATYAVAKDRHFVAFTTDKRIDKLMEADVYFVSQDVSLNYLDLTDYWENDPRLSFSEFGEKVDEFSYLKHTNKVDITAQNGYWWGNKNFSYSWDEISKVDDFIASVNYEQTFDMGIFDVHTKSEMTEDGYNNLRDKEWVLSFATTDYITDPRLTAGLDVYYTIVGEVSILRLAFETDGYYYNLGVIDNKQTGVNSPVNTITTTYEFADWFKTIMGVLLLIVLLVVLAPILPIIFTILFAIVKLLIKIIIWVITVPFRLIGKILKK